MRERIQLRDVQSKSLKYDALNVSIYNMIEPKNKILDIGSATGQLGRMLKQGKDCFMVGIEKNEKMATLASSSYDKVIVADVENLFEFPFPNGFFDIIVFGDVLEHLREPAHVLKRFRKYLSDNGYIIVSLPNVANWLIRLSLLIGRFEYEETGILDKTHLHFFTLKSALNFIESSGYKVVEVRSHNQNPLAKCLARLSKSLFAHQLIFKAVKR